MKLWLWILTASVALALSFSGCNCGTVSPLGQDGGRVDAGSDGGVGRPPDAGPGSLCLPTGQACSLQTGGTCCSGICGDGGVCKDSTFCGAPAAACVNSTDCCSNSCVQGKCSNQLCHDVGQTCATGNNCCTGSCDAGQCVALVSGGTGQTCKFEGQACTAGTDCCSTNCQGNVCVVASACRATSDLCYKGTDCCSGNCSVTDGGPGFCISTPGSGGGGCNQDGVPCSSGSNCCSRTCLDPGTGVTVCALAGGCQLTGDTCNANSSCCGGLDSGFDQGVTCSGSTASSAGLCTNGMACNASGNICGANVLPDGGKINAPQDCCDGHQAVCKLSSEGIPRCFGGVSSSCPTGYTGAAPCCINTGAACAFKDQCCNGDLCIGGADGGFTCQSASCLSPGTTCTPGADAGSTGACCSGTTCTLSGSTHVCAAPSDGGVQCALNSGACVSNADCCSESCINKVCASVVACQTQYGACSASSDCCSGLSCSIGGGATTGSCVPSTCPQLGQSCSPTNPCCSGISCVDSTYNTCTGSTPCTCSAALR